MTDESLARAKDILTVEPESVERIRSGKMQKR